MRRIEHIIYAKLTGYTVLAGKAAYYAVKFL